ncbi:hypothetical protein CDL12_14668 [Handroanthus impetiginosus]|uniref:Wall-associated receptor kinase galacturonan-binding domain-containing protein n=1 Tax=Handroanthus impetiginosus TaxID=429701 RepID=A0A2G9H5C1_9LAMI|nr:hypothetical protein CDL12_14668 [Handroanthus impetiginosus]
MLSQNLLLKCFSYLFMIMICFLQTSYGKRSPHCSPSKCGHIHNISYPFRLRDDPKHCGDPKYQLSCENNTTTTLYLVSQNYHVQAINYENQTIHLTDPAIKKNDICSFPQSAITRKNLWGSNYGESFGGRVIFMSCPHPVSHSALFLETTEDCFNQSGNHTRHTYIKFGYLTVSDVCVNCSIDLMAMSSFTVKDENNVSLSEIHSALLYGFELSYFDLELMECRIYCYCQLSSYILSPIYCRCEQEPDTDCEHLCTTYSFYYYKYGKWTYASLLIQKNS